MVEPKGYLERQSTASSHAYLEYEPSEKLNQALLEFVKPELRDEIGRIALLSVGYFVAPLDSSEGKMKHPPKVANYLSGYEKKLQAIQGHQIRLASFMEIRNHKNHNLTVHLDLLPSESERDSLGQLAIRHSANGINSIGVAAHISHDNVNEKYGEAAAQLRGLLAMSHPAVYQRQRISFAPLSSGLWVLAPVLRDKEASNIVPLHPDIKRD
jgi:hypothetical protein